MKHDHTKVFLESLLAINVMNCGSILEISRFCCCREEEDHRAIRIVDRIIVERLGEIKAVRLCYVPQSVLGMYNLIDYDEDLLLIIVREI